MSARREEAPRDEAVLAALGDLVRREVPGDVATSALDRGRARALAGYRRAREARRRPAVWLAAAALVALATLVVVVAWPRAPLGYTIEGTSPAAGGYVHARADGPPATVRFGDGSVVTFAAGSGGRVAEVGPRGARVLLESGQASFHVAHLPAAQWSVEAGPFVIAVVGTIFDVSWSADAEELDVRLREGAVVVRGPPATRGVELRAGQHLVARLGAGEIRIDDAEATAPATTSVTTYASASASASDPAPPGPSAAPLVTATLPLPASGAAPRAGWPQRVAAGDFRGVVADAEARGLEAALRRAPLVDLVALADAARYASRADVAERALLAQRARFGASPEARAAAFLLGRLADDGASPPAAAIDWYDRYLREAPGGVFADEALGRELAAQAKAGDPRARGTAAAYLRAHPDGPHAARAREILAAP